MRKIRERQEAGAGEPSRMRRAAYHDAAQAAFRGDGVGQAWDAAIVRRQSRVRALYQAQAALLAGSGRAEDRRLAVAIDAFVRGMPQPDTQRLALARELRAANQRAAQEKARADRRDPGNDSERKR